jgi:hypothetical protein
MRSIANQHITKKFQFEKCHICRRSANLYKNFFRTFADSQFAELICGPPTSDNMKISHSETETPITPATYEESVCGGGARSLVSLFHKHVLLYCGLYNFVWE